MIMNHRIFLQVSALLTLSVLAACAPQGNSNEDQAAPHTGAVAIEEQFGALSQSETTIGAVAYVASERLRVRTSPEILPENIAGVLDQNDKVEIVDPTRVGSAAFIGIRVLESKTETPKGTVLYTSANHLNTTRVSVDTPPAGGDTSTGGGRSGGTSNQRLFVVVNVATEKVRVYRPCAADEGCVNRLVFEQDVVNGQDEDGTRTDVGHYRINDWQKFYETPGRYPAWYKAGYPAPPNPGDRRAWFSSSYMPGGRGEMRGAFGWYTLRVGPNPNGQWMHGTAGWGADKKDFITFKDSFWGGLVSLFTSIRSHGCTRIDNESIAYLRSQLPVGTTYVKIYAAEGYRDSSRRGYSRATPTWPYIMTKNGGGVTNNHQLADRDHVLSNGTPRSEWIEEGSFTVDQHPDAVPWTGRESSDLYKLGSSAFRGVFLVDEGTVIDYRHPSSLTIGGFSDRQLPTAMMTSNRSYTPAGDAAPLSSEPAPLATSESPVVTESAIPSEPDQDAEPRPWWVPTPSVFPVTPDSSGGS